MRCSADGILTDSFLEIGYGAQCWGLSLGGGILESRPLGNPAAPVETNYAVSFSVHLRNLGSVGTSQRLGP
jgi:hypothetical protein